MTHPTPSLPSLARQRIAALVAAFTLALLASPASADPAHPARLTVGDHVMPTHVWDADTDTWSPTGPEVSTACFRVAAVDGSETTLVLVSGRYVTHWDGVEQAPGYQDTWLGTDEVYRAKHPDAAPRELAQGLFTTVAACVQ